MSELWIRVLVVIGALVIVALVVLVLRRPGRRGQPIEGPGLAPGIYLFTSGTCADCGPARERLKEKLGPGGFREIGWEAEPDVFARVGIDVVPCTLVVGEDGSANSFPGLPDRVIEGLSP
jgi:hypothetical protein